MSIPTIEVSGLSKRYVIEHQARHNNLRDHLHHTARRLWRRVRWGTGFQREEFWALQDVSFAVRPGEVVGIIGRNGAGKSTLLKILSRITEPTAGKVTLRGRVASLLEVGTGFHPDLTGRENIFLNGAILGMSRTEIRRKFDEIVDFAEIERFLDTPVKRYSSGMYVRLAFAVAAHLEPEILIVDEVLAVGDAQFQKKCLGKMQDISQGQGRTVLFVSHNLGAIVELCSAAILLQNGRLVAQGDIQRVVGQYRGYDDRHLVRFESGPLRSVEVVPSEGTLRFTAHWRWPETVDLPAFGFVVHDELGRPVFGANPRKLAGARPAPATEGVVDVTVSSPRLREGRYRVSVWFGNSRSDLVEHLDCLGFEIDGRGTSGLPATSAVGVVLPECTWQFGRSS